MEHPRGDELTLREDLFLLEYSEDVVGEGLDVVEAFADEVHTLLTVLVSGVELVDVLGVLFFEFRYYLVGPVGILLVKVVRDFNEAVGGTRHCGEDDDFDLSVFENEVSYIFHARRRADRRATELKDFHLVSV